jgi:hypothetical protein
MNRKARLAGLLVLLGLLLIPGNLFAGASQESAATMPAKPQITEIVIGVSPAGGSWYALGGAMADIISRKVPNVKVSLFQGGGESNVIAVQQGTIDIGITQAYSAYNAYQGIGERIDKPFTNVSGFANLYEGPLHFVVHRDSGIQSIADLKGKRISSGLASFTSIAQVKDVLKVYGMSLDQLSKVEYVGLSDGASLFKDRHIDAFIPGSPVPFSLISEIASTQAIRILSLEPDKIEDLRKLNPSFSTSIIPAGTYKGVDSDVRSIQGSTILIIRTDFPEDLAYEITKALLEEKDTLVRVHNTMKDFDISTAPNALGVPTHPGALRYYREKGAVK